MKIEFVKVAATIVSLISMSISIFQLLLASGFPLGEYAWGGKYKVLPEKLRVSSFISFFVLNFITIVYLQNGGILNLKVEFLDNKILLWIFTFFFALNTLGNLASKSKKEKQLMTPITIIATLASIIVAI